ncbi:MAG: selenocysteine-specific translation factor [Clostridia bacterium]|nr:selenocysteine-specific translation factor [Clostridia bacterium]
MEDIKEALAGSVLAEAPIIPVSAVTGEGKDALKQAMEQLVAYTPAKSSAGKVRLPIDRVFSITGFGTVVTGTLWTGSIKVGDTLELQPEGLQVRVRTLQVHGQKVEEAKAGQRVAVNLAGIETGELARGSTLLTPETLAPSYRIDLQLHLLAKAPPMENRQRVRIHLGTGEVLGRVILLDREELAPGETAFAQLQLEEPLVAAKKDRLVIRSYSPMHTIAGGLVVDPAAPRHRRFDDKVLEVLATRLEGTPEELALEAMVRAVLPLTRGELSKESNMEQQELEAALANLLAEEQAVRFSSEGTDWYWAKSLYDSRLVEVKQLLEQYHYNYPLRPGFPKEELRSRLFAGWVVKAFNGILQYWQEREQLAVEAGGVRLPGFEPKPSAAEQELIQQVLAHYQKELFQPPAWEEVVQAIKKKPEHMEELLHYLLGTQQLVRVAEGLYFHRQAVSQAKDMVRDLVNKEGSVQLAAMRDAMGSSRKYVLPLLEYFDQIKFTKRIGDKRVLFSG